MSRPQNGIRAVIFDLGGVLLNLDESRTVQMFSGLIGQDFAPLYSRLRQQNVLSEFETGRMAAETFRNAVRRVCAAPRLASQDIDQAWNAMLIDQPPHRLELLLQMKDRYRTFLFSNTNEVHLEGFQDILRRDNGVDSYADYFEKEYYSHLLGMRKPDVAAFRHILRAHKLDPATTLLLDDNPDNIFGAEQAGMKAWLIDKGQDTVEACCDRLL